MKRAGNILRSIFVWIHFLFWGTLVAACLLDQEEEGTWEAIAISIVAGTVIYGVVFRLIWKRPGTYKKGKKVSYKYNDLTDVYSSHSYFSSSDSFGGDCGGGDGSGDGGCSGGD